MKKILLFCVVIAVTVITFGSCSQPTHPRILLKAGEEKELLKKINKDEYWKEIHQELIAKCDSTLDDSLLVRKMDVANKRLVYAVAVENMWNMSYAYRMTGEKKYFDRAVAEMRNISAFTDWNPKHFLDVAQITMALAVGYDWLYNDLSEQDREMFRQAIIEKGLKQSEGQGFWKRLSNWNQVCSGGMVYGALAVMDTDPEIANAIIEKADTCVRIALEAYEPDGAYPEGPGYWGFGTIYQVLHISALEKEFGTDNGLSAEPGFMNTGMYSQQTITSTLHQFNYADNGSNTGLNIPAMWFYSKLKDPALLYMQKRIFERDRNNNQDKDYRNTPALLIWGAGSGISLANAEKPTSNFYIAGGTSPICVMRTGWDNEDIYVGVKAGVGQSDHGHLDVGSFIVEADGERWLNDFGSQGYASVEAAIGESMWDRTQSSKRWDVFRYNNMAHNTLTFDNQKQDVTGAVDFYKNTSEPNNMSVAMDLTPAYAGQVESAKRGIAMEDQKYIVVEDVVKTADKGRTMRWNLLTDATVELDQAAQEITLTKGDKKFYIKVNATTPITLKTWSTKPSTDYEAKNEGTTFVGFETKLPANSESSYMVYLMPTSKITTGLKGSFVN